ncbi:hypothetical protein BJ165DRAFT_1397470 [Panaeolus papilionaceus]|nr:hypothetical protein BJ165DRAFT_1397470 [Panaeolus papilionaceus]
MFSWFLMKGRQTVLALPPHSCLRWSESSTELPTKSNVELVIVGAVEQSRLGVQSRVRLALSPPTGVGATLCLDGLMRIGSPIELDEMNQGFHVRFACHQGESDEEKVLYLGGAIMLVSASAQKETRTQLMLADCEERLKRVAILHASRQLHKKNWKWRLTQRRMNVPQIIGVLMNVDSYSTLRRSLVQRVKLKRRPDWVSVTSAVTWMNFSSSSQKFPDLVGKCLLVVGNKNKKRGGAN